MTTLSISVFPFTTEMRRLSMYICEPVCNDVRLVPMVIAVPGNDDEARKSGGAAGGGGGASGDLRVAPLL